LRFFKLSSFEYVPRGRGGAVGWFKGFDLLGRRWGVDISTVYVGKERYLDRWILYVNGYTLRLHRFWRGDDDRASHTHPWWFVTFPLAMYHERVYDHGAFLADRWVEPWRPHFRPANFEHYVLRGVDMSRNGTTCWRTRPFWTIVLTGPKRDTWGFYPFAESSREPRQSISGRFINWKDYE
jgi:hypothetical protein